MKQKAQSDEDIEGKECDARVKCFRKKTERKRYIEGADPMQFHVWNELIAKERP